MNQIIILGLTIITDIVVTSEFILMIVRDKK